jgi:hypothetical protein
LHPHPDSSKFPSFTLQRGKKLGAALSHDGRNGAGVRGEFELSVTPLRNANTNGEGPRQVPTNDLGQCFLAVAAGDPRGQGGVGSEDALQGLRVARHGGETGGGASAPARSAVPRKGWREPN